MKNPMTGRGSTWIPGVLLLSLCIVAAGCSSSNRASAGYATGWMDVKDGIAVIESVSGSNVTGTLRFTDVAGGVRVVGEVQGLNPNQEHAIHIHEYGDCSALDASSAGGHYDPERTNFHSRANAPEPHHAGDLGNLQADAQGTARYDRVIRNITVAGPRNPIVGRAIIIHAESDKFDQPTGSAGGRLGCGVIGIAK